MTKVRVYYHPFMDCCMALEGKTIKKISGRSEFLVLSVHASMRYRTSTGGVKIDDKKTIGNILAHFNHTRSWKARDYKKITDDPSYVLALIKEFLKEHKATM